MTWLSWSCTPGASMTWLSWSCTLGASLSARLPQSFSPGTSGNHINKCTSPCQIPCTFLLYLTWRKQLVDSTPLWSKSSLCLRQDLLHMVCGLILWKMIKAISFSSRLIHLQLSHTSLSFFLWIGRMIDCLQSPLIRNSSSCQILLQIPNIAFTPVWSAAPNSSDPVVARGFAFFPICKNDY